MRMVGVGYTNISGRRGFIEDAKLSSAKGQKISRSPEVIE